MTIVSSSGVVAPFANYTAEQAQGQAALIAAGVKIVVSMTVAELASGNAVLRCVYSGNRSTIACGGFIPVTSRAPDDHLWQSLQGMACKSLIRIGDCKAPGLIVHAVYDGHRAARELCETNLVERRERIVLS